MGRFTAGFNWMFGIASLFGLILIHLLVVPAVKKRLAPVLLNINGSFSSQYDFIFNTWNWIFYILMFGIIFFMIASIFVKERQEEVY